MINNLEAFARVRRAWLCGEQKSSFAWKRRKAWNIFVRRAPQEGRDGAGGNNNFQNYTRWNLPNNTVRINETFELRKNFACSNCRKKSRENCQFVPLTSLVNRVVINFFMLFPFLKLSSLSNVCFISLREIHCPLGFFSFSFRLCAKFDRAA